MQKTLNRAAVFAHYDKNNLIQDYVVYYIKELKKIADTIIFVSDSDLPDSEQNKIKDFTEVIIAKPHGEYDFGSYKRGFQYLETEGMLNNINELIFANDSCFGPLFEPENLWREMDKKPCDFWGISYNLSGLLLHVQSYFLVFKSQVFKSDVFKDFIHGITKQESKDEIVKKYEIKLSQILIDNKFLPETYLKYAGDIAGELMFSQIMPPFIKISLAKRAYTFIYRIVLNILYNKYKLKYPQELIFNYLKKYSEPKRLSYNIRIVKGIFFHFRLKERRLCILGRWFSW